MGKGSIKFKASQLWNQLFAELKQIRSQNIFKRHLKLYLLNNLYIIFYFVGTNEMTVCVLTRFGRLFSALVIL